MRAYGYLRLSKWDEGTTSPQRQREAVKRLCRDRGWELARMFEDIDVSGWNGKRRPGLEEMLSRLGEADALVVYRIDRLARSSTDFSRILERLGDHGVQFVATDMQVDDSPAGTLVRDLVARLAQFESDQISERTRRVHAYLREQGKWQGGRPPFGWRLDGDGALVPHPEEQARLEDAARRYVGGEALHTIARDLGMHHPSLHRILRYARTQEALPDDLAEALARALVDRSGRRRDPRSPLLSGIARCGVCGGPLYIVSRRKDRGDWGSYGCAERGHVNIAEGWLDAYVVEKVLSAIDTGQLVKRLERRRKRALGTPDSRQIEARLELLTIDHYEKGIIGRDVFLRRREGLLKRLEAARKAEEDRGIDLPRELAMNLSDAWPRLTVHEQRRIVGAVLERVEVRKAEGHGKIDPRRVKLVWRG